MRVGLGFDRRDASPDSLLEVIHRAIVEALRGASGLEAVPTETEGLREAIRCIERYNYQVVNLDVTVLGDRQYPEARLSEIRENVAALVHVAPANVALKEGEVNPIRRLDAESGIAAIAVTLLDQISDLDALHASIRSGG